MGLRNIFRRQASAVIQWTEADPSVLFQKAETPTDEVKNASKLVVSAGQGVILVYDGKVQDVLAEPGVYLLDSDNTPFITTFLKLRQNFESEHKMHLWFFRTTDIINVPWGTFSMVKFIDAKYNIPVELGANGNFSLHIAEPQTVFLDVTRQAGRFTVDDMREVVASRITPALSSFLAGSGFSYRDIDSKLSEISQSLRELLNGEFAALGLQLTDMRISSTVFDEATCSRIAKIADIAAEALSAAEVGLDYVELEKLRALRDAARNEGGLAGAGLQMGVGLELGKTFDQKKDEATAAAPGEDPMAVLKRLKLLLDEQVITQEEYDRKKTELLERI